ncbi:MAG: hypothetical protein WCH13_13785 [Deltaproteobacteria bacterium]
MLDKGAIAESGTHDALLARNGIYAMLHRLQAGDDMADFGLTRA